jgi:hypothetical protein
MHKFCTSCPHRLAPKSIRLKFNEFVRPMFFDCPLTQKHVVGCTIKFITIDWKAFANWLKDNNQMTDDEIKTMKVVGLYEEKDV